MKQTEQVRVPPPQPDATAKFETHVPHSAVAIAQRHHDRFSKIL